ncbi:MAG: M15 family metallopeptidase [Clostridia bacterium]|nr:M15 family metallopeptidase [Clostridia bacterium]MEE1075233.1 M15 family metallopeptidase [Acutalibacteraceae bacterium]
MTERQIARRKAIIRRRIFLGSCFLVLALIVALLIFMITAIFSDDDKGKDNSSDIPVSSISSDTDSSENQSSDDNESNNSESMPDTVNGLDANFSSLLLVNGENPLPETYDSEVRQYLVEIDPQYRNNNYVTQIHKDVYPYITAMVAAAQADGVDLRVWSPFRSYAIQNDLFQKQVARVGGDEEKAATVVARPGTSEHNTGLCADFNMASDAFENTKMYSWMVENAEDYGFIMRYRKDKQPITGVIHESWHWRFVGINHAKQINKLDMCLEEYVEYLEKQKNNTNKKEN